MPMMSDYDEDLDDFPTFSAEKYKQTNRINGWSISRRINRSMDRWTWNHYENSTTLKNKLVGDAEMHKGLLDRSLRAEDGVKFF